MKVDLLLSSQRGDRIDLLHVVHRMRQVLAALIHLLDLPAPLVRLL